MAQRKSGPSGKRPSEKTAAGGPASGATKVSGAKVNTSKPSTKPATEATSAGKARAAKSTTAGTSTPVAKSTAAKSTAAKSTAAKSASRSAASSAALRKAGTKGPGSNGPGKSGGSRPPGGRPPARRGKPKSIVNQKQTPWGLIAVTAAVVVFAAAVVFVVVATHKSGGGDTTTSAGGQSVKNSDPYRQPELPAAAKIKGVTYTIEGQHTHVDGHIKYDSSPPVGGDHSQYWADCTGTVYPNAIANENAVHMLEHGAIWITYNKDDLAPSQVKTLSKYVSGIDRMAMSPYPNLKTPISLQSWGYQLRLSSPTDPRIAQFIAALKYNQKTTPEYGATCSQPTFKDDPSTFGNPLWVPKSGSGGNVTGA